MTGYAELAVTTNFSFLRGASGPREFVRMAKALKLSAIGIADRNTLAGVVRAYSALEELRTNAWKRKYVDGRKEELKLRLLVGTRLCFVDGTPDILAYPTDFAAYRNLCRLLTKGKMLADKGECILSFSDLPEFQNGLLFAVMPGEESPEILHQTLLSLREFANSRVWLAAAMPYHGEDAERLSALKVVARVAGIPLLAVNDALYHKPKRKPLQDVVTCIREHITLDNAGRKLQANAERHLKPSLAMTRLFREAPEAISESLRFAERISFTLDDVRENWCYPSEPVPPGMTAQKYLEQLTWEGANKRYRFGVPDEITRILEKELQLIAKLGYADYFITVHDIVRFAREGKKKEGKDPRAILCQGRGSAANSAVCYVLGVTAVDPMQSKLLVERFMSEERKEPPDIDVDFEHERREEVIQDIFERYGRSRAALTATVISYRPRSAIREVGKVFGLTEDVTAALAGTVWGRHGDSIENQQLLQARYDSGNRTVALAVDLTNQLIGFPRHLSQHVGGFVLARDRLDELIPIGNAAMEDRSFIEWDKDDIDALGIMKVDILALGMLTCIRKAFDLINLYENNEDPYELATIPRENAETYEMLCKADSIGVFQVESRAQMSMLPRLKPREFYDLVIEVAIVRPGPIQGDMVNPYLKRRSGMEEVTFPAPASEHGSEHEMKEVLGRTMGVPLFQEQAMQLAITAAQFTADEANGLRRAMATFRNLGTIHKFRTKFIEGMVRRGYERDFAERCFKQIEGFGSYGFPESHAASFAQLVYVSSWLKCHHPAAFACALLNSQPMGFYAPAEIVRDAREHGVEVREVDINFSHWDNTLEIENGVPRLRLGFRQIGGMNEENAKKIVLVRRNGFYDLGELKRRTKIGQRVLMLLAEADAFNSLKLERREALWATRRIPDAQSLPLFGDEEELPPDTTAPLPLMPLSEHVLADYQSLRLSLKGHPMQFLRDGFSEEGILSCAGITQGKNDEAATCAGIVLVRQQPGDGNTVFVTLSDETGITNVVIWQSVMKRYRKEVMGARLLQVEGRIQRSPDNVVHLVAERMTDRSQEILRLSESLKLPSHPEHNARRHPRNVRVMPKSRDFH